MMQHNMFVVVKEGRRSTDTRKKFFFFVSFGLLSSGKARITARNCMVERYTIKIWCKLGRRLVRSLVVCQDETRVHQPQTPRQLIRCYMVRVFVSLTNTYVTCDSGVTFVFIFSPQPRTDCTSAPLVVSPCSNFSSFFFRDLREIKRSLVFRNFKSSVHSDL